MLSFPLCSGALAARSSTRLRTPTLAKACAVPRKPPREGEGEDEFLARFIADPEGEWPAFLERYTGTIMSVLVHLCSDPDDHHDVYLDVLVRLRAVAAGYAATHLERGGAAYGQFGRLIRTITRTRFVDFCRTKFGLKTFPLFVQRLGPAEQRIYELHFQDWLPHAAIVEILAMEGYVGWGLAEVIEAADMIYFGLGRPSRWAILLHTLRRRGETSLEALLEDHGGEPTPLSGEQRAPDARLIDREDLGCLRALLARLDPVDVLILQYRFGTDLSYAAIAVALALPGEWEVRRRLKAALEALRRGFGVDGASAEGEQP